MHWARPSGLSFPSLSLFSSQPGPSQFPRHPCSCFYPEHEVWSVFPPSLGLPVHQALPPRAKCQGLRRFRILAGPRSGLLGFLICQVESSLSSSVSLINSSSRLHFSRCLSQWLQPPLRPRTGPSFRFPSFLSVFSYFV